MWILSLTTIIYETYYYNSTYIISCSICYGAGKKLHFHLRQDKTSIKWTEERKNGKIYLHTVQGGEKHEYILGSGYKTESWKIVNTSSNTNLSISLNNGIYSISGKFNGKQISKKVKSKGKPWYQNIAYNAGLTLKNGRSVEYEGSRPATWSPIPCRQQRKELRN